MSLTATEVADLFKQGDIAHVEEGGMYYFLFHSDAVSERTAKLIRDGAFKYFDLKVAVIRYQGRDKPQLFRVTS